MPFILPASSLNDQIEGCQTVPIVANADERGCLSEIFRSSWSGTFPTVQWNACASGSGVVRGAHVHADYDEYYTLLQGHVVIGLADIRRGSLTFGRSVQLNWSDRDRIAIVVPAGVAHVVYFETDAILVFGLSSFWSAENDDIGCQWNAPELNFDWPATNVRRSPRDSGAGGYSAMLHAFEKRSQALGRVR